MEKPEEVKPTLVAEGAGQTGNSTPTEKPEEPCFRYETKNFADTVGRMVTAFLPIDPTVAEPKFVGTVQLPSRQGPMPVQFGLEGTNIDEAFDSFDECFKKAMEEIKREANKPKLVLPGDKNISQNVIKGMFQK